VTIVKAEVKLDLTKVFLPFNKLAHNVMVLEKQSVKHAQNVEVMAKFKAMKMFP
jgi:hypothetical protein